LVTYGGQAQTASAINSVINSFRNFPSEAVAGSTTSRSLDKADATPSQWEASYSGKMGSGQKWNLTTTFLAETTTGADFNDAGDSVSMALWKLPHNLSSGSPGTRLGTIRLSIDGGGDLQAMFAPVPEPSSVAVSGLLGLGALGWVIRNRRARRSV
jgi:hypothetical protein